MNSNNARTKLNLFLLGSLILHLLVYFFWLRPRFEQIQKPGVQQIDLTSAGGRPTKAKTGNNAPRTTPTANEDARARSSQTPAPATTSRGSSVSEGAGITELPAPEYPKASRSLGEQGVATVEVHFNEQGLPVSQVLRASSGFARLDKAALNSIKGFKIAPGQDLIKTYKIVFQLQNNP